MFSPFRNQSFADEKSDFDFQRGGSWISPAITPLLRPNQTAPREKADASRHFELLEYVFIGFMFPLPRMEAVFGQLRKQLNQQICTQIGTDALARSLRAFKESSKLS